MVGDRLGAADLSPLAAPARATDFAGLPPTFLVCGALDLFLEENLDYGRRMIRAGVPVELHIYPGVVHGFAFLPDAEVTQIFTRDSMAALRRALTT
ncbi:MAG: alpha/beta hydrolase fold domain-containing protein [Caulobacteraceae bacterium]|nr:alpha/beta hydrolase fold domain-containing protein [Caulobacteraceae bacterium]